MKRFAGLQHVLHWQRRRRGKGTEDLLPEASDRLRDELVWRLNSSKEWKQRRLVLCKEELLVALDHEDKVIDRIPLHEVSRVRKMENDEAIDNGSIKSPTAQAADSNTNRVDENSDGESLAREEPKKFSRSNSILNVGSFKRKSSISDHLVAFNVHTQSWGANRGRTFSFRARTSDSCGGWVELLNDAAWTAKRNSTQVSKFTKIKEPFITLTESTRFQHFFAFLIAINFFVNIVQSETLPASGTSSDDFFNGLDTALTIVFVLELALNMFAKSSVPLWRDAWLTFDFVVVFVSVVSSLGADIPGMTVLRILRIFRVFRIFARLRSLRMLINSLTSSLLPVVNAHFVVMLFITMWAILAVNLYEVQLPLFFDTFSISTLTLIEVATLDRVSIVADSLLATEGLGGVVFLYFFVVIAGWTLLPVVVAVLLENFVVAMAGERMQSLEDDEEQRRERNGISLPEMDNPLSPLLQNLSRFSDEGDLNNRIRALFYVIDDDVRHSVGYDEMKEGLAKITDPPIVFSYDDWERMTCGLSICNDEKRIDEETFLLIMRQELLYYIEGLITKATQKTPFASFENATISALKVLMIRTSRDGGIDLFKKIRRRQSQASISNVMPCPVNSIDNCYVPPRSEISVYQHGCNSDAPEASNLVLTEVQELLRCIRKEVNQLREDDVIFRQLHTLLSVGHDTQETSYPTTRSTGSDPEFDESRPSDHTSALIMTSESCSEESGTSGANTHTESSGASFPFGSKTAPNMSFSSRQRRLNLFKSTGTSVKIRVDMKGDSIPSSCDEFKTAILTLLNGVNCIPRHDQLSVEDASERSQSFVVTLCDSGDKGPLIWNGAELAAQLLDAPTDASKRPQIPWNCVARFVILPQGVH